MESNLDVNPNAERRMKFTELAIRIEHYKYYLGRALHVTVFFYAITGGVLGIYLKDLGSSPNQTTGKGTENLEYFLLLPILIGSILGGVFIYGARLQEVAVDTMEHIRDELCERLGLGFGEIYDAHLLNILLRIFGYIYFLVAFLLVLLPLLLGYPSSKVFYVLAALGLFVGLFLPLFARWLNNRLEIRRTRRKLKKLKTWRRKVHEESFDTSNLQATYFYHEVHWSLSDETIKHIKNGSEAEQIKKLLRKDLKQLKFELRRKEKREKRKRLWAWWARRKIQTFWDWFTSP